MATQIRRGFRVRDCQGLIAGGTIDLLSSEFIDSTKTLTAATGYDNWHDRASRAMIPLSTVTARGGYRHRQLGCASLSDDAYAIPIIVGPSTTPAPFSSADPFPGANSQKWACLKRLMLDLFQRPVTPRVLSPQGVVRLS